jgi:hypothetical protein
MRAAAVLFATLAITAPALAQSPAPLVYVQADDAAARHYWGDMLEIVNGLDMPPAVAATVRVATAHGLEFAYLSGAGTCGTGHGCMIRVFKDGQKVSEFSACEDLATHAVTPESFYDCGTERPLPALD